MIKQKIMYVLMMAIFMTVLGTGNVSAQNGYETRRAAVPIKNNKQKYLLLLDLDIPQNTNLQKCISGKMFGNYEDMCIPAIFKFLNSHDHYSNKVEQNMTEKMNIIQMKCKFQNAYKNYFISYSNDVEREIKKPNKKATTDLPKEKSETFVMDMKKEKLLTVADMLNPEAIKDMGLEGSSTDLMVSSEGIITFYTITDDGKRQGKVLAMNKDNMSMFSEYIKAIIKEEEKKLEEAKKKFEEIKKDSNLILDYDRDKSLFDIMDQIASFPGGDGKMKEWLSRNVKYPAVAEENGVQGRVIVRFVVGKDGSISKASVIRSVDPSLDKEALRVVRAMPRWMPSKIGGEAVAVWMKLPVTFSLQ